MLTANIRTLSKRGALPAASKQFHRQRLLPVEEIEAELNDIEDDEEDTKKQLGMPMIHDAIIIFGSSRSNGFTRKAIELFSKKLNSSIPIIDLSINKVTEFSYEYNQLDDFRDLVKTMLNYELIILATPVYWYSVSAKMKCFIDRLSDLLAIDKESGRRLRGKKLAVIASYSTYPEGIYGFEKPTENTASYLGMTYLGCYFHYSGDHVEGIKESTASLNQFVRSVLLEKSKGTQQWEKF